MSALVRRSSFVITTVQLVSVQSMPAANFFSAPMFEQHMLADINTKNMLSNYIEESEVQHKFHSKDREGVC